MSMDYDLLEQEDKFPRLLDYKYIEPTDFYKLYYNYVLQKQYGKKILKDEYLKKQILTTFNGFITFTNYLRDYDTYGARRYIEMFLLNNRDLQECKDENIINFINKMYELEKLIKKLEKTDDGQFNYLQDLYHRIFDEERKFKHKEKFENDEIYIKYLEDSYANLFDKYKQDIIQNVKNEELKNKLVNLLSKKVNCDKLEAGEVYLQYSDIFCDFLNISVKLKFEYYHYNELLKDIEEFTNELENKRWLHRDFSRYTHLDKVNCYWNNEKVKKQIEIKFEEYKLDNIDEVIDLCENLGNLWVYINDRCIKCDFIGLKKYIIDFIENNNELYETILNEFNELRNKNEKWYADNLGVKSYEELLKIIDVLNRYGSIKEIIELNKYIDEVGNEEAEECGLEKIDIDIDILNKFVNEYSLSTEYEKLIVLKTLYEDFNTLKKLVNIDDDYEMINKHLYKIVFKDDNFEYDTFYIRYFIENKVEDKIYLLEFDEDDEI